MSKTRPNTLQCIPAGRDPGAGRALGNGKWWGKEEVMSSDVKGWPCGEPRRGAADF